jgi:hypothetical protein
VDVGERGSQAVEFALVLPAVLLLAVTLLHVAVLGSEFVVAEAQAAQAARTAAVAGPGAARALAGRGGLPGAAIHVTRRPGRVDDGDWYVVELRAPSRAFRMLGLNLQVRGRGWARAE